MKLYLILFTLFLFSPLFSATLLRKTQKSVLMKDNSTEAPSNSSSANETATNLTDNITINSSDELNQTEPVSNENEAIVVCNSSNGSAVAEILIFPLDENLTNATLEANSTSEENFTNSSNASTSSFKQEVLSHENNSNLHENNTSHGEEVNITSLHQNESREGNRSELIKGPNGEDLEKVEIVHKLSPYAEVDLHERIRPENRNNFLIGKPLYVENNITYDETPNIFDKVVTESLTGVVTPVLPHTKLWKNFKNKMFHSVPYGEKSDSDIDFADRFLN